MSSESPQPEQSPNSDGDFAHTLAVVLTALYLPGLARPAAPRRAGWLQVVGALRRAAPALGQVPLTLEQLQFWEESLALHRRGLLSEAETLVSADRVLTASSPGYPRRWERLGSACPPALWMEGEMPPEAESLGIVGSRNPPTTASRFAKECAREATSLGLAVVSGGAPGCDLAAARGAGTSLIELLPCGMGKRWGAQTGCRLSARPPDEDFSSAAAMERNTLLYAWSDCTLVAHSRFKVGGAWVGATNALRRRLTRVLVWDEPASLASRALVALGAVPLDHPQRLGDVLGADPMQSPLL